MAILSNPELVATPAPGIQRYGLFNAATVLDNLDAPGIASGFQFPAEDCGVARPYDANCDTNPTKTFDEGLTYMEAEPYWVYATLKCGTVGKTAQEIETSVRRKLAANEQRAVEEQLWGGSAVASEPSLTTVAGVSTVTPTAPGAGAAIAALEAAFYAEYGYVGTIHVNTAAYAQLAYAQLVSRQGAAGSLVTPIGSVWSFGAGYGVTGPAEDAPDAGTVWAFMTPPVLIRRSTVIVPQVIETMDRSLNQYMGLAERVYAHTWACDAVFAVQVPVAAPAVEAVTTV
jgi:hypothetical protein